MCVVDSAAWRKHKCLPVLSTSVTRVESLELRATVSVPDSDGSCACQLKASYKMTFSCLAGRCGKNVAQVFCIRVTGHKVTVRMKMSLGDWLKYCKHYKSCFTSVSISPLSEKYKFSFCMHKGGVCILCTYDLNSLVEHDSLFVMSFVRKK